MLLNQHNHTIIVSKISIWFNNEVEKISVKTKNKEKIHMGIKLLTLTN